MAEVSTMGATGRIFLEFNLPNAPTWFYFSGLLAIALFFKFSRLLSIRNLDIVMLFLQVPGFLLLLESSGQGWPGYLWLFCGSGFFLVRCLIDLVLDRRPALSPNLNLGGMAWLAGALIVSLGAVAVRAPAEEATVFHETPASATHAEQQAESIARNLSPEARDADGPERRFWVARTLAVLCHLAIAVGLVFVGWLHFQDLQSGMAAATCYLLLPYTYLLLPYTPLHVGQWYHSWPLVLIVWALVCYRWPLAAGLLLGLAAGTTYFPVVVMPIWLSFYRSRGAGRFLGGYALAAGLCLAAIGGTLWFSGELPPSIQSALSDWQPWKELNPEEARGFWTRVPWAWAYRLPVFIAYIAFVATTLLWPSPKTLAHVIALSTAVLVCIQFWYADRGGAYVLWYLPLLILMVFRPNLADRRPMLIDPETDWLTRLGRWIGRGVIRLLRPMPHVAQMR